LSIEPFLRETTFDPDPQSRQTQPGCAATSRSEPDAHARYQNLDFSLPHHFWKKAGWCGIDRRPPVPRDVRVI